MSPRILFIGASGYIGGSTLSKLLEKYQRWQVTVLVRNEEQALAIHQTYPDILLSTVIGSLATPEILATEAANASIVLQLANGDHEAGTDTILSAITSAVTPKSAKYYLHLSGAATVLDLTIEPGLPPNRTWNDTTDLPTILAFPPTQIHSAIEQRIVSVGDTHAQNGLRTAILSPPAVIGVGIGPVKKGAAYHLNMMMQRKKGFVVGEGRNTFDTVHVKDVADAIVTLVEAAAAELQEQHAANHQTYTGAKANWNKTGYYFLTSRWKSPDTTTYVKAAVGLLKKKGISINEDLDHLTVDEASSLHQFGPIMFGGSLRVEGRRLREGLGWESSLGTWEEALNEQIDAEIEREARGESLGFGFGRE